MFAQNSTSETDLMEKASAYAFFYRVKGGGPGKWRYAGPARQITMLQHMKRRKVRSVPLNKVWSPAEFNARYDYICIRVDVPKEYLEEMNDL